MKTPTSPSAPPYQTPTGRRCHRFLLGAPHRVSEWQHEQVKVINVKKHQRLGKSIFRVGLDMITDALFKLAYSFDNALELP